MWYRHRTPTILQWFYPSLTWHRSRSEKSIYLTFDDGPIPEITPMVLNTLKQYDVKATFFCVGDNAKKHPELLSKVIEAGHRIGNHTSQHLDGWKTELDSYVHNIESCDEQLDQIKGSELLPLFRPPYGKIGSRQINRVKHTHQIVMWDVLSGDFDQSLSPEKCLHNTIKATRSGSIVVFHDNVKAKENVIHALPRYIDHFRELGFEFKTL